MLLVRVLLVPVLLVQVLAPKRRLARVLELQVHGKQRLPQLWQSGFAGDATATAPATGARLTISSRGTRWREQLPSPHLLRLRDYDSTWRAQRNNAEPLRRAWAPNAYQC